MKKILEVKNLSVESKETKKKILENISFEVEKNSIYALIGPNGAGKSTLAYTLMGIPRFKVVTGKIIFKNKDITKFSIKERVKMGLALAFQEPSYFENIRVKDFLKIGNKEISEKEIKEILSLVGLEPKDFLNRKINRQLSSGERKRIEFASVIAMKPELMILDEPDSGLDIIIYKEFYNILENLKELTKSSIILITHREEIGAICDKAGLLYKGKIIEEGSFRKVMKKYCQIVNRKKVCKKFEK